MMDYKKAISKYDTTLIDFIKGLLNAKKLPHTPKNIYEIYTKHKVKIDKLVNEYRQKSTRTFTAEKTEDILSQKVLEGKKIYLKYGNEPEREATEIEVLDRISDMMAFFMQKMGAASFVAKPKIDVLGNLHFKIPKFRL